MGEKETASTSDAAAKSAALDVVGSPGGSAQAAAAAAEPGGPGTPGPEQTAIVKSKSNITNN